LSISQGSAGELETQLLLAETLNYLPANVASELLGTLDEVSRMLVGLKATLKLTRVSHPTTNY
jgi:four helix bundle protein